MLDKSLKALAGILVILLFSTSRDLSDINPLNVLDVIVCILLFVSFRYSNAARFSNTRSATTY